MLKKLHCKYYLVIFQNYIIYIIYIIQSIIKIIILFIIIISSSIQKFSFLLVSKKRHVLNCNNNYLNKFSEIWCVIFEIIIHLFEIHHNQCINLFIKN